MTNKMKTWIVSILIAFGIVFLLAMGWSVIKPTIDKGSNENSYYNVDYQEIRDIQGLL